MRLAGKVALITGAAAGVEGELMGFGGAAARLFACEGARVVLTDIKEAMARKTAEQIWAQGGEAVFFRHDVTSEEERRDFHYRCAYCLTHEYFVGGEAGCTIDHHRPLRGPHARPDLLAEYTNLYWCCRECNENKRETWPSPGRLCARLSGAT